mmetsp:Transcript_14178/g.59736  ORF Transcript_14178/g.59736 Transcript_14178/m.59736 type:complete len:321 (-) Transcript_14178:586-1548(-)
MVRTSVSVCHSSLRSISARRASIASASAARARAACAISSAAAARAFAAETSISRCLAVASAASRASRASIRAAARLGDAETSSLSASDVAVSKTAPSLALEAALAAICACRREDARSFLTSARSAARARTRLTTSANCAASSKAGTAATFPSAGTPRGTILLLPTSRLIMACTPTAATSAPSATLPILPSDSAEGAGAGAGVVRRASPLASFLRCACPATVWRMNSSYVSWMSIGGRRLSYLRCTGLKYAPSVDGSDTKSKVMSSKSSWMTMYPSSSLSVAQPRLDMPSWNPAMYKSRSMPPACVGSTSTYPIRSLPFQK